MKAAMKAGLVLALGGAAFFAAAVGPASAGGSEAGGGAVIVHRGAQMTVESESTPGANRIHGVAVQRGRALERKPARRAVSGPDQRVTLTAGEELWLIDRRNGRLVACQLRKTSTVGQSAISCSRRSIRSILN